MNLVKNQIQLSFLLLMTLVLYSHTSALGKKTYQVHFLNAQHYNMNTIHLPIKMVHRLITVEAQVENVVGTFIIDTGLGPLVLNLKYFQAGNGSKTGAFAGTNGISKALYRKNDCTIELEQFHISNQEARLLDLSHIEKKRKIRLVGILGYELLKDFEVFLDYPSKLIILTRLGARGDRVDPDAILLQPFDSMKFDQFKHLIILKTQVENVPLLMILDTGAEINLLDRLLRKKVLNHFHIKKRINTMDISGREVEVLAGTLNGLKCGPFEDESMRTLLTNLDHVWESIGLKVHGFLGFEFLQDKKIIINYKKRKLYFFKCSSSKHPR